MARAERTYSPLRSISARHMKNGVELDNFDLLTLATVAKLLHRSKAYVSNVIAGKVQGCGPIPAVRLGRRMLVPHESLRAWIERNEAANDNLNSSPERGLKRG